LQNSCRCGFHHFSICPLTRRKERRLAAAIAESAEQEPVVVSRTASARAAVAANRSAAAARRENALVSAKQKTELLWTGAGIRSEVEPLRSMKRALTIVRTKTHPRTETNRRKLVTLAKTLCRMPPRWSPSAVEALLLQQDRFRLNDSKIVLASLVYECSKLIWSSFIAWLRLQLAFGALQGLLAMQYVLGDETPTACKVRDPRSAKGSGREAIYAGLLDAAGPKRKRPDVAKVFQLACHVVFVVKGSATGNQWVMIHGEMAVPLATMDRVTAESVHAVVEGRLHIPGFNLLAEFFPLFLKGVTTDAAGYNKRYRKAFDRLYPECLKWENDCDIHTWNNALGASLSTLDTDISGCIAVAIALEPSGSTYDLRTCLALEIEAALEVYDGAVPPPDSNPEVARWHRVLEATLSESPSDLKRHFILKTNFNGGLLKHFAREPSKTAVSKLCSQAFLPAPVPLWKRSRWAKTLRPLREFSLLFSLGVVFEKALRRWLRQNTVDDLPAIEDNGAAAAADVKRAEFARNGMQLHRNSGTFVFFVGPWDERAKHIGVMLVICSVVFAARFVFAFAR
jgi:hypothetical protein